MAKWGTAENWNQNYSSMANALVMLSFMTTGYVERPSVTEISAHADLIGRGGTNICTTSMSTTALYLTTYADRAPAHWTILGVRSLLLGILTVAASSGRLFYSSHGTC